MQRSSVLVLLGVAISLASGCDTTSTSQIHSNWDVLRQAKRQECEPLPKSEKEIAVQYAKPLRGDPLVLVLQHISRGGLPLTSYTAFAGDAKIPYENLKPMNLSDSSTFLGGGVIFGRYYTVVANRFGGKPKIELRALETQNVEYSVDGPNEVMRPVGFQAAGDHGFWVAYKADKEDESIEDQPVTVMHVHKAGKGNGLTIKRFNLPPNVTRMQLLAPAPDRALAVWAAETKAADGIRTLFRVQEMFDTGGSYAAQDLKFQSRGTIESWAAANLGSQVYISFVEGDSLMGEASLRTVRVDWRSVGSKVAWDKKKLLPHEHVADPQILTYASGAKVILLKWLDRESTLGVYHFDGDGNLNDEAYGVFPEGTQLSESFYDAAHDGSFAVLRSKGGLTEDLILCGIP